MESEDRREDPTTSSVTFQGNVGDIQGSQIIGGDSIGGTASWTAGAPPLEEEPTVDDMRALLDEIRQEIAAILAQEEALKQITPSAPGALQNAQTELDAAAEKVQPELDEEEAQSMQERLEEAADQVKRLLTKAERAIKKAGETAETVRPVYDKLVPLAKKLTQAGVAAAKLWPLIAIL